MEISEVDIREFDYRLEDVGTNDRQLVYEPGSVAEPPGYILTLRTTNGLEGTYRGIMFAPVAIAQIEMAASDYLLGRDPLQREAIWQDIWQSYRHTDHLGLGPIDIALWDLAGKYFDEPVATLLGGYKETVPAYASTFYGDAADDGLNGPEAYAEFAETCRSKGYPGIKVHPFGDPDEDIAVCRAIAGAVGDDMDLMLDASSEYTTFADARKVGKVLDDLEFFWYEDPMADTGQSLRATRRLADAVETPILLGEHVQTGPYRVANYLDAGDVDMVRGDAHLNGGITGVMKAASTAETFGVDIELLVGGPSHLHCISAIRNTNYFEHAMLHPHVEWVAAQGFTRDIEQPNADGEVPIPDGPGLGVDIDWAFVESRTTDRTLISR